VYIIISLNVGHASQWANVVKTANKRLTLQIVDLQCDVNCIVYMALSSKLMMTKRLDTLPMYSYS